MLLLMYDRLITINIVLDIAFFETYKKGIEIWYSDSFKQHCFPILAGLMVDYKKQVLIINSKANMQCSLCHVSPKKRKYMRKL